MIYSCSLTYCVKPFKLSLNNIYIDIILIRNYLPYYINKKLFGDRDRYGQKPNLNDSEWIYWRKNYLHFNNVLQKSFLTKFINSFNYKILENIDFKDKVIAELGGGIGDHNKYFNTYPKKFFCMDTN